MDYRSRRSPGLPCAAGFNGVLRALLGERCTVAPVALRFDDARARSGRRIAARLDASLSGVRTTRLLRPRTAWPSRRGPMCTPPAINQAAVTIAVSSASRMTQRVVRPCHRISAPALPRPPHPGPHLVTIAKRPSGKAGMGEPCHKSEFPKSRIFLWEGIDRIQVFCPTPLSKAAVMTPSSPQDRSATIDAGPPPPEIEKSQQTSLRRETCQGPLTRQH